VSFAVAGFLFLSVLLAGVAGAQVFNFNPGGFTTANVCANSSAPASTCQILTNGSPNRPKVITGGILRLNTANTNQHASAWYRVTQPLNTGFTTAFQFTISNTGACFGCSFPADGMALVIQGDPAGTGALGYTGNGQNIAYGNNDLSTASGIGRAIRNSLAVELDTFKNVSYGDPNGNHIAVQSCGPNNPTTLSPNSADHNYLCADGKPARLALQSLPAGVSLSDGKTHTITVNYLPPASGCTSNCNNFSVYLDSTLLLQTTVDITQQLKLDSNNGAYIGFTAATGSSVQNDDIVSWSFSQLPLSPITITQPLQTTATTFNYTPNLTASTDYSQSGLPGSAFTGVFQQGTVQSITDQQFADLVNNTPFQGSTCLHQDLGTGTGPFACVTTTDLCTTATNATPSGANCPSTGGSASILASNNFNADPAQKPIIAPGYIMGKDTALSCGAAAGNDCKGLINIFDSITGDPLISGTTKNFNSVLIPIVGAVQPSTSTTTAPTLNSSWANQPVVVTFNSADVVPPNNNNPPPPPDVTSINYSVSGANVSSPASGTITGNTGQITIPADVEGSTVVTFSGTDTSGTQERVVTTDNSNQVTTSLPTLTINIDLTKPTLTCNPPTLPLTIWTASDVSVPCMASDAGSGLADPSQANFIVSTTVSPDNETNNATIPAVTVQDVAGNPSNSQGPFDHFLVDKKAPAISAITFTPPSPIFGQPVTASFICTDGGSGVVLCDPNVSPEQNSTSAPVTDVSVGTHNFTVHAKDQVGNTSDKTVSYTVGQATPTVTFTGAQANAAFQSTFTVVATTNASTTPVITASGACSIAGSQVTMTSGTGTCSLAANWAADDNYLAAAANQSTNATLIAPTVTFTGAQASAAFQSTFTVAATTNASTTPVITASGACSIAGTLVTMTSGTGTCSLTANWAADNNYASATAGQSTTANRIAPTVTFTGAQASAVFGSQFTVASTTNASTTPVITASGACSIVGTLVTMTSGTGTCALTANWAADNNYLTAAASQSTNAIKATTTTTITSTSPSPGIPGSPVRINVSVVGSTNVTAPTGTVTVTASTLETCSAAVSAGGCSLTFATTGARTVTASYIGDGNFQGSSTSGSVQVIVGDFSITATPASQTISSGHQATYTITVTPIGGLTGVVNLSCSGAPPNSTCSISPSADNLSGAPVNSTVTLSANKNVNHGTFTLTFTGSYGGGALVHSVSVSLTVKGQS
jgi:hypothetical protein